MSRKVNHGSRVNRRAHSKSGIRKFCNGRSKRMRRLALKEGGWNRATVKPTPVVVINTLAEVA